MLYRIHDWFHDAKVYLPISLRGFTDAAFILMLLAEQEAERFHGDSAGAEHILLGLMNEGRGVDARAVRSLGVDLWQLRDEVQQMTEPGPEGVTVARLPQNDQAKRVIEQAKEESRHLHQNYVGTEHLLLGLLCAEAGVAAQVLRNLGLNVEQVRGKVVALLGGSTRAYNGNSPPGN
ncbi:MAG TPA: Clp protease N-terminal domain-containing protein [Isosphaeraceae bacterium]|nr:Clp protease N-terminal domain-containing protein [Isosphaeraceae bacterium]